MPLLAVDQGNHKEELTDLTPVPLPGERESPWRASSPVQTWDRSELPSKSQEAAMVLWYLSPNWCSGSSVSYQDNATHTSFPIGASVISSGAGWGLRHGVGWSLASTLLAP